MSTKTVLLVEDNDDSRTIFSTILEKHGYRVVKADNGVDGVRLAGEERPDLILMNVSLPLVNGCDATEMLKGDPTTCMIPVVVISAHATPGVQAMAFEAGAEDYLHKPIRPTEVLEEVQRRIGPAYAVAD